jgi:hypothetical protein
MIWFKRYGWIYIPITAMGIIVTILAARVPGACIHGHCTQRSFGFR